MPYRFPEQLRFSHLAVGETFQLLPDGGRWHDKPLAGTYRKTSARCCVPCQAHWAGTVLRVTVEPGAPRLAVAALRAVRSGID